MNKFGIILLGKGTHKLVNFLTILILLFWLLPIDGFAHTKIVNTIYQDNAYPWAKVECIMDSSKRLKPQAFHSEAKRDHMLTREAFGTNTPSSNLFLLHYAPNWNKKSAKHPILLVHGAGDNASRGFAHPWAFDVGKNGKIAKPGIMQALTKKGHSVFAITFSHSQGDNFYQAHQLANAIKRIKEVTKSTQVDIVCHSKGSMAVRIYTSNLGADDKKYSWIHKYRNDVRKIIFIASPIKGIDTAFRYYNYNFTVKQKGMAAPLGPRKLLWMGMYCDNESYNKQFPGQFQMLHNWVNDGIPFKKESYTMDMNLTMYSLYNGGTSALLVSDGIDATIKKFGNVIERLCDKGVDPAIDCYILAGSDQVLNTISVGSIKIPIGEFADKSDGVLFLKSATYVKGLTARGAKVKDVKVLPLHHVSLASEPSAFKYIIEALGD